MISKELLVEAADDILKDTGLFLVDVKSSADNVIEIVVDGMEGVGIDRCVEISKAVEARFDRDVEDYELTVSSAGIGDPLKLTAQYRKHEGREVEVLMKDGTKLCGIMTAPDDEIFSLTYTKKVEQEGKKRKVLQEFTDVIRREEVKSVRLVIKMK